MQSPYKTLSLSIFMGMMIAVLCGFTVFSKASAQDSTQKPKLVAIEINKETNDQTALEIAKKIDPDFFNFSANNNNKDAFVAKFIPLTTAKNTKKFLVYTAYNNSDYCTGFGCPYYFVRDKGNNQWELMLSLQAHSFFYDEASMTKTKPANLISSVHKELGGPVKIWLWNGQYYQEAKK